MGRGKVDSHYSLQLCPLWPPQEVLVVKKLPAKAADVRDAGSIPGSGRSPGGRHDNPLQYSCLQNSRDRGALVSTDTELVTSEPLLPGKIKGQVPWSLPWLEQWSHLTYMLLNFPFLFLDVPYCGRINIELWVSSTITHT